MPRRLIDIALYAVIGSAIATTAFTLRREFRPTEVHLTAPTDTVRDWRDYSRAGRRIGPDDALVQLVVFSDYECSACRTLAGMLYIAQQAEPEKISVTWRHATLPNHPIGAAAAVAAECAARQGTFRQYHEGLFANFDTLPQVSWSALATATGVSNMQAFEQCVTTNQVSSVIHEDSVAARRLKVVGTPTLLVDSLRYAGAPRDLLKILKKRLRDAS